MELSLRDAARILNVPDQTVSKWIQQGELPALKTRGQYRINKVELQEWAQARNLELSPELFAPGGRVNQLPSLSKALARGGVHLEIPGAQRNDVLRAITELEGIPDALDRALLFQLLLGRESLASTGIGEGIAIPHPRDPLIVYIDEPIVLLAHLKESVDFDAIDGQRVSVLFLLLSPNVRCHLQLLSRIMVALHDEQFRGLLQNKVHAEFVLHRLDELEDHQTTARIASRGT